MTVKDNKVKFVSLNDMKMISAFIEKAFNLLAFLLRM